MQSVLGTITAKAAGINPAAIWDGIWPYLLIFLGFSAVIFVHELGHFLAAKWAGVRVERFAIGFFREVFGFTWGETRYSFNILPLGGYVKMLGQEDFDDKGEELVVKNDPRAFTNKPVGKRMIIVSAGVVMNVLFAGLMFVIVFMHGVDDEVTTIGYVVPESPAARAGLQPGDTVKKINGREIREYDEIRFAVILSEPHDPIDMEVDRGGKIMSVAVQPEPNQQSNLLQVGIAPASTREVMAVFDGDAAQNDPSNVRPGDVLVEIDGKPVTDETVQRGIEPMLRSPTGAPLSGFVERRNAAKPDAPPERVAVKIHNEMVIEPSEPLNDKHTRNVLGLIPLVRVSQLDERGRAALAGLEEGDVITKFGPYHFPTQAEIIEAIRSSASPPEPDATASWRDRLYQSVAGYEERGIAVRVERKGHRQPIWVELTPKSQGPGRDPLPGFMPNFIADENLRIAGVVETINGVESPAKRAGIPKGAVIREVNAAAVGRWYEVAEQFRQSAGTTVPLVYESATGERATVEIAVPHCLRTVLGLTTVANIIAIDNEKLVTVQGRERRVKLSANYAYGLYHLLKSRLEESGGKPTTVTVRYQEKPGAEELERDVTVSPDMIDPWLGRIQYKPIVFMRPRTHLFKADGPIDALAIGAKKTVYFVVQVYTMMQRMIFSRSLGLEHMSGPLGIVKTGGDVARVGFVRLLFFLAIISANLAVINFLPLPIVDGGLMVFLIIEKIKGSPVSLKIQVATQMIGLCLLGAAFLFVTFNDVVRLWG